MIGISKSIAAPSSHRTLCAMGRHSGSLPSHLLRFQQIRSPLWCEYHPARNSEVHPLLCPGSGPGLSDEMTMRRETDYR